MSSSSECLAAGLVFVRLLALTVKHGRRPSNTQKLIFAT